MNSFQNKSGKRKLDFENPRPTKLIRHAPTKCLPPPAFNPSHFSLEGDLKDYITISSKELEELISQNSHQIDTIDQLRQRTEVLSSELNEATKRLRQLEKRLDRMEESEKEEVRRFKSSSHTKWDPTPSYIN